MSTSVLPARPLVASSEVDWASLNAIAASFIASTPLAAQIASVTPVGGHVAIGLQTSLTDILDAATSLTGMLAIAVDTLTIPAGTTLISAPAVSIVARTLAVDGDGSATLQIRSSTPALQVTTASISGSIAVSLQQADGTPAGSGDPVTLALSGEKTPQLLTVAPGATPELTTSTATNAIADSLHVPWAIVALEASSAVASVLIDQSTNDATALAADMLRWVTGGCYALIAEQAAFTTVDYADVASLLNGSIGLLAFTQTTPSGATYVPVLSTSSYEDEINALLAVAATYDAKIAGLASQENVDQQLAAFASTLKSINQDAETPLFNTLQRLNGQAGALQGQLQNAALQLEQIGSTLPDLQQQLVDAINDQFQQELLKTAMETLFTVATLYVGVGITLLGDPALLTGEASAMMKAALEVTKQLIEAGEKTIDTAIKDGASAATNAPTAGDSQAARQGAQYLAGSIASFGSAANALWTVVNIAAAGGQGKINMTPDVLAAVEKLPDLSGFSVGGLDPVTYWDSVVEQTELTVQPHIDLPQAKAYLAAMKITATYGKGVGDLQMKLLDLYTQGMAAFDQLRSVYQAEAKWDALGKSLQTQEQKLAAAQGLLERGYLAVKRNLVIAVENYRAAFLYQWLQPSPISIDVSMDYLTLQRQATASITGLQHVLTGTPDGTVRPRQPFQHVTYLVQPDGAPLFTVVNGQPQAQWSITTDDLTMARQLNGNTAIFLTEAKFELVGGTQDGEVELQVETSGQYENKLGGQVSRFVSSPVSMSNDYTPGSPPEFITSWQFADPAAYMMPSPYTSWTLTVNDGNWQDATAIKITVSGKELQNPK